MRDELQHAVSKSFHLSSSSLNCVVSAGTAARLIYHNRDGIAACQENLSFAVLGFKLIHEVTQIFTKSGKNPCISPSPFV